MPHFTPVEPVEGYVYEPNPRAAKHLARLIQYNHKPPLDELPQEWFYAADAVDQVASRGRRARFEAFVDATRSFSYEMVEEVNTFIIPIDDPEEKARIYYEADDAYHEPPPTEWAVDGLLTRPSLNLLVGPPGCKKTWAALDLAVAVASGQPWLDLAVQQSPVVFVDEETGLSRLWNRVHSVLQGRQPGYGTPLRFVSYGGYDLRQPEDIDHLINRCLTFDAQFIVIDTLVGVIRGGDENSVLSIQPLLYNLRRLAEYCHAAVLLVHHTNRSGTFRGSSSIMAVVDLMLGIQSPQSSPLIQFDTLKTRHAAPPSFCAEAHFEQEGEGSLRVHLTATDQHPVLEQRSLRSGVLADILDYLEHNTRATGPQLIRHFSEYSPGTVKNAIHHLVTSGQIQRTAEARKGKTATFILPPADEPQND